MAKEQTNRSRVGLLKRMQLRYRARLAAESTFEKNANRTHKGWAERLSRLVSAQTSIIGVGVGGGALLAAGLGSVTAAVAWGQVVGPITVAGAVTAPVVDAVARSAQSFFKRRSLQRTRKSDLAQLKVMLNNGNKEAFTEDRLDAILDKDHLTDSEKLFMRLAKLQYVIDYYQEPVYGKKDAVLDTLAVYSGEQIAFLKKLEESDTIARKGFDPNTFPLTDAQKTAINFMLGGHVKFGKTEQQVTKEMVVKAMVRGDKAFLKACVEQAYPLEKPFDLFNIEHWNKEIKLTDPKTGKIRTLKGIKKITDFALKRTQRWKDASSRNQTGPFAWVANKIGLTALLHSVSSFVVSLRPSKRFPFIRTSRNYKARMEAAKEIYKNEYLVNAKSKNFLMAGAKAECSFTFHKQAKKAVEEYKRRRDHGPEAVLEFLTLDEQGWPVPLRDANGKTVLKDGKKVYLLKDGKTIAPRFERFMEKNEQGQTRVFFKAVPEGKNPALTNLFRTYNKNVSNGQRVLENLAYVLVPEELRGVTLKEGEFKGKTYEDAMLAINREAISRAYKKDALSPKLSFTATPVQTEIYTENSSEPYLMIAFNERQFTDKALKVTLQAMRAAESKFGMQPTTVRRYSGKHEIAPLNYREFMRSKDIATEGNYLEDLAEDEREYKSMSRVYRHIATSGMEGSLEQHFNSLAAVKQPAIKEVAVTVAETEMQEENLLTEENENAEATEKKEPQVVLQKPFSQVAFVPQPIIAEDLVFVRPVQVRNDFQVSQESMHTNHGFAYNPTVVQRTVVQPVEVNRDDTVVDASEKTDQPRTQTSDYSRTGSSHNRGTEGTGTVQADGKNNPVAEENNVPVKPVVTKPRIAVDTWGVKVDDVYALFTDKRPAGSVDSSKPQPIEGTGYAIIYANDNKEIYFYDIVHAKFSSLYPAEIVQKTVTAEKEPQKTVTPARSGVHLGFMEELTERDAEIEKGVKTTGLKSKAKKKVVQGTPDGITDETVNTEAATQLTGSRYGIYNSGNMNYGNGFINTGGIHIHVHGGLQSLLTEEEIHVEPAKKKSLKKEKKTEEGVLEQDDVSAVQADKKGKSVVFGSKSKTVAEKYAAFFPNTSGRVGSVREKIDKNLALLKSIFDNIRVLFGLQEISDITPEQCNHLRELCKKEAGGIRFSQRYIEETYACMEKLGEMLGRPKGRPTAASVEEMNQARKTIQTAAKKVTILQSSEGFHEEFEERIAELTGQEFQKDKVRATNTDGLPDAK